MSVRPPSSCGMRQPPNVAICNQLVGDRSNKWEPVSGLPWCVENPYLIVFALLEIGEVEEDAVAAAASLMSIAQRGNA
jgi:hypothetical protein